MRKFIARFRQAPMFSSVYILGAALSVASVMLVAIFLHVKTSNIYPEYARDRLLYDNFVQIEYDDNRLTGGYAPEFAAEMADSLQDYAYVAFVENQDQMEKVYAEGKRFDNVQIKAATSGIFSVYDYEFIEGAPFPDTTDPIVVISDKFARRIFGTDHEVVGRKLQTSFTVGSYSGSFMINESELTVVGVFKEGSRLLPYSFAEIIRPVNLQQLIDLNAADGSSSGQFIRGSLNMIMLPKPGVSREDVARRMEEVIARKNSAPIPFIANSMRYRNNFDGEWQWAFKGEITERQPGDFEISIRSWPRGSLQMALGNPSEPDEELNLFGFTKLYVLLALILLLVPALNLSSLISGNMDTKMSEMGIRKAFGARNSTLLRQVVNENLWLTGCGAILGIILSWIGVVLWKEWLFAGVGSTGGELSTFDIMLDPSMLFAPKVFIAAVVICMILNLLASLIPAWWALRRPAIAAIRSKT